MSVFPSLLAQFDGQVLPGGQGKIVALEDTVTLTALPITDLQGIPFTNNMLTASGVGVLPAFRTGDYRAAVSWVSGNYRMDIPALDMIPGGGIEGQVLARAAGGGLEWIDPPQGGGSGGGGGVPSGDYWNRTQTAPVIVISASAPWPTSAPEGALIVRLSGQGA